MKILEAVEGLPITEISEREDELVNKIYKECNSTVKAMWYSGRQLYHGFTNARPDALYSTSRENRKPLDATVSFQQLIDDILEKAGFEARRGNSVFCSTNERTAASYSQTGETYLMFPVDGQHYELTWSTKHGDMFGAFGNRFDVAEIFDPTLRSQAQDILRRLAVLTEKAIERMNAGAPELQKYEYAFRALLDVCTAWFDSTKRNTEDALGVINTQFGSGKEIAFVKQAGKMLADINSKLIGNNISPEFLNTITPEYATKVAQLHGFKKGPISSAIQTKTEIYLRGKYIAIHRDLWISDLAERFERLRHLS